MDPRNRVDLLGPQEGVYPVLRLGRRRLGARHGRGPVGMAGGSPEDPLRASACNENEEEQGSARGLLPDPGLGAVAQRVGPVARLPPAPVPVDGHRPMTAWSHRHDKPPAPHGTLHGAPAMHWEVVGRARLQQRTPIRIVAMSDSNGSPQRDDRHHRRSRPRSPVSPGCAGETPPERKERRLVEAAGPVWPPAEQPQAPPSDPEPPVSEPVPAGEAAPAAQATALAVPPPGGAGDAHGAATTHPASHAIAPGTPLARGTGPARARRASPGRAASAAEGREGAKYRAHTKPSHTHMSPPKANPPKAASSEGRPRPVRAPTPKRTPMGITLPQLQRRVVQAGGDGDRMGGACKSQGCRVRGGGRPREGSKRRSRAGTKVGQRSRQQRKATDTREGPGRSRGRGGAGARAGRHRKQHRGRADTRERQGHGHSREGHRARQRTWAGAREGHGRLRQQERQGRWRQREGHKTGAGGQAEEGAPEAGAGGRKGALWQGRGG